MNYLLIALAFTLSACGSKNSIDADMVNFCSHATQEQYCAHYNSCSVAFPINQTTNGYGGGFSCSN